MFKARTSVTVVALGEGLSNGDLLSLEMTGYKKGNCVVRYAVEWSS